MKRLFIKTLGCKVNQFESEAIAAEMIDGGWTPVAEGPAEVCIVNTCAVTAGAAMQSRQAVRRCRRETPGALVIVTGCCADMDAEKLKDTGCVDLVVGHDAKHRIVDLIRETAFPVSASSEPIVVDGSDTAGAFPRYRHAAVCSGGRTRPFLKIQDGCNAFCSYCIVPHTRGRSVSMPPDEVLSQVRIYAAGGFHELVLTGIHLGAYGLDLPGSPSLFDLLRRLDEENVIPRVRLSSIEPLELTDEIIALAAGSNMICDHFHIPLQSGDDAILKKMGRPYTAAFFAGRVELIKKRMPGAAVGADLLVGFPGEDASAVEATRALINDLPISYLHVFPFSPRPGTPAYAETQRVPPPEIKRRCSLFLDLGNRKKDHFARSLVGTAVDFKIEEQRDRETGCLKGVSTNYLTVLIDGGDDWKGRLIRAEIVDVDRGLRVRGRVLQSSGRSV